MEKITKCAVCDTNFNSTIHLESSGLESTAISDLFSARRLPDRIYYQWVRCDSCSLLRSDPIQEVNLANLYEKSTFDYSSELEGLTKTYLTIVNNLISREKNELSIFEVGGGNGFFLAAAKDAGFSVICGVEPSAQAIRMAREDVQQYLKQSMMGYGVLPNASFHVGTMFHTLDHLSDPALVLNSCKEALQPGGLFVVAVHNERSFSAKLLRGASPIYDVEHTYLFSEKTAKMLFEKVGFENIKSGIYWNTYSLAYILHLLPISRSLRKMVLSSILGKALGKIKVKVPLGNIWVSGMKPLEE